MKKNQLLTTQEAAETLGVSANTLQKWRWTKRSDLAFTRVGGKVFYAKNEIVSFLKRNTQRNEHQLA